MKNQTSAQCNHAPHCVRDWSARLLVVGVALLMFWATSPAKGLVVTNVTANNTAPTGDQGFSYVGKFGTTGGPNSGVYLGFVNGFNWVLTAHHNNSTADFYVGTESFSQIESQRIGGGTTDLRLVKLDGGFIGLDALEIRSAAITTSTAVTMVGNGRVADGPEQDFDPALGAGNELLGFAWTGTATRPKLWGTNEVSGVNIDVNGTTAFRTDFDDIGGTEATLADKDSGSGVFINNGGTWELAGIGFTIGQIVDANRGVSPVYTNSVYGDESYMVDLTQYRTEILASLVPEPTSLALLSLGTLMLTRRRRG